MYIKKAIQSKDLSLNCYKIIIIIIIIIDFSRNEYSSNFNYIHEALMRFTIIILNDVLPRPIVGYFVQQSMEKKQHIS